MITHTLISGFLAVTALFFLVRGIAREIVTSDSFKQAVKEALIDTLPEWKRVVAKIEAEAEKQR